MGWLVGLEGLSNGRLTRRRSRTRHNLIGNFELRELHHQLSTVSCILLPT